MELTDADIAYVREGYVPFEELCAARGEDPAAIRAFVARRLLPAPTYVLPDGTEMVPRDYFDLADEAGGPEALPDHFRRRAAELGLDADDEWEAYLTGVYGVCLRRVSVETIASKGRLVDEVTALLDAPDPSDAAWRERLRCAVDELDGLERDFAPDYDRSDRFPLPPTRDRLIRAARERYAEAFRTPAGRS